MKKLRVDPGRARNTSEKKENKGRIAPAPKVQASGDDTEKVKPVMPKISKPKLTHHRKAAPRSRRAR